MRLQLAAQHASEKRIDVLLGRALQADALAASYAPQRCVGGTRERLHVDLIELHVTTRGVPPKQPSCRTDEAE